MQNPGVPLSMSMFATRKDYESAVEKSEEYHPEDAFNEGEAARFDGFGVNPYSPGSQPICRAAWKHGFNGTKAAAATGASTLMRDQGNRCS